MSVRIPSLPLQRHASHGAAGSQDDQVPLRNILVSGSLESTGRLELEYILCGELAQLRLPADSGAARTAARRDELWRHTCMELFARGDDAPGYLEFNFSPRGNWAAYGFDAYRAGRRDIDARDCRMQLLRRDSELHLRFGLSVPSMATSAGVNTWHLGLAAIVEDEGGALSYWALQHPRPQPDFHDALGFSHALDAPTR